MHLDPVLHSALNAILRDRAGVPKVDVEGTNVGTAKTEVRLTSHAVNGVQWHRYLERGLGPTAAV